MTLTTPTLTPPADARRPPLAALSTATAPAPRRDDAPRRASPAGAIAPGLALVAGIAVMALAVVRAPQLAGVSPMMVAMTMGIAVRNVTGATRWGVTGWAMPGIGFSVKRLLRIAIVLLGLQLTVAQLAAVGASGLAIIAATLTATFAVTVLIGRWLGVDRALAELIAAGTSICGASAVIATNTVTRAADEDASYAVACVTVFGSVAMLAYPWLPSLLGLDPHGYGLWAGASIHEVAQAVAAGFEGGREAGDVATIAKLSRVTALAPMVLLLGVIARARTRHKGVATARPPLPWFVLGFVAMIGVGSVVSIPGEWKSSIAVLTSFLLSTALAAMGLDTDVRKLAARGVRPALLGALATLFIAGFSLALIKLTG